MEIKDIKNGEILVFCKGSPKQFKKVKSGSYKYFMIKRDDQLLHINAVGGGEESHYLKSGWRTINECKQCKWGLKAALMSCPIRHRFEAYNA